jgi:hypothetical protein
MQEAPGQVSRLESSVDNPLGGAAADNLLCIPFGGKAETVGIIGNGPISSGDRRDIDKLDVVVRFNLMNNWQRFQEKIGTLSPPIPPPLLICLPPPPLSSPDCDYVADRLANIVVFAVWPAHDNALNRNAVCICRRVDHAVQHRGTGRVLGHKQHQPDRSRPYHLWAQGQASYPSPASSPTLLLPIKDDCHGSVSSSID